MKTEEEMIKELKYRCQFVISQSESYSSYRANMNFVRGILFCLGFDFPKNYNLATIMKQFNIKKKRKNGEDFEIKEIKKIEKNYFRKPTKITDKHIQALRELIED